MTIRKPTLASAPSAARKHPIGFLLGLLVGGAILAIANILVGSLLVFIGLNLLANLGLSFAKVVGFGFLLATIKPTFVYTPPA